jgi:hypothetical protein
LPIRGDQAPRQPPQNHGLPQYYPKQAISSRLAALPRAPPARAVPPNTAQAPHHHHVPSGRIRVNHFAHPRIRSLPVPLPVTRHNDPVTYFNSRQACSLRGPIKGNHPSVGLHGSRRHGPVSARSNEEDLSNETFRRCIVPGPSGCMCVLRVRAPPGLIWINDIHVVQVVENVPDLRLGSTCSLARATPMDVTYRGSSTSSRTGSFPFAWPSGYFCLLFCESTDGLEPGNKVFSARHTRALSEPELLHINIAHSCGMCTCHKSAR